MTAGARLRLAALTAWDDVVYGLRWVWVWLVAAPVVFVVWLAMDVCWLLGPRSRRVGTEPPGGVIPWRTPEPPPPHRTWRPGDPEPGPAPYTDGCHTSRPPAPEPLGPCVTLPDIDHYQPEEGTHE